VLIELVGITCMTQEPALAELALEIPRLSDRKEALQKEIGTDLDVNLTTRDARKLTELTQSVSDMEKNLAELHARSVELTSKRDAIQIHLHNSLEKRLADAQRHLTELEASNR
jgi:seryl-tRNA synthetase